MNVEDVIAPIRSHALIESKLGRRSIWSILVVPVMSWHTKPETEIR